MQKAASAQAGALRELQQAARRLEAAYRRLSPNLREPERLTLRYYRVQGRAAWILSTYGRLLPEDVAYRLQGRLGAPVLSSPFDEAIPSRRALARMRQTARELLEALAPVLSTHTRMEDLWSDGLQAPTEEP